MLQARLRCLELSAAAESSGTCVESSMRVATGRSDDQGEASLRVIASGGLGGAMIGSERHHVETTSILMHVRAA